MLSLGKAEGTMYSVCLLPEGDFVDFFFSLVIDQSLETVQILSNFGAMRQLLQIGGTQVSGGNVPMSNPSKPQTVNPLYISMTYGLLSPLLPNL